MQRWELATSDTRDALRRYFRQAQDEALDALVEMHAALSKAREAKATGEPLQLAELEVQLAAAVAVEARRRTLDFEAQAEAAVAAQPWPEVTP
jgi:hypothetical protein